MDCFTEILRKHLSELENCLPYGDIIGKCVQEGIVTEYEYHDVDTIRNKIKRNRDTVLKIINKPPILIENFCRLLQNVPASKELGAQLVQGTVQ